MQLKLFSSSQGLSQNAHKKLRFSPGIVYVDGKLNKEYQTLNEYNQFHVHKFLSCLKLLQNTLQHRLFSMCLFQEGGVIGQSVEERRRTLDELQAMFKATGFRFHIVPLEQVSVVTVAVCYST